jgi:major membrane immunogen (membrane-anchored lipoprotein)
MDAAASSYSIQLETKLKSSHAVSHPSSHDRHKQGPPLKWSLYSAALVNVQFASSVHGVMMDHKQ